MVSSPSRDDYVDGRRAKDSNVLATVDYCNGLREGLEAIREHHLLMNEDFTVEELFASSLRYAVDYFKLPDNQRPKNSELDYLVSYQLPEGFAVEIDEEQCAAFDEIVVELSNDASGKIDRDYLPEQALLEKALQLTLQSLDTYSSYRSGSIRSYTSYGAGIEFYRPTAAGYPDYKPEYLTVLATMPCSPFQALRMGDKITKINGQPVKDNSYATNVGEGFLARTLVDAESLKVSSKSLEVKIEYIDKLGQRWEAQAALVPECGEFGIYATRLENGVAYLALRKFLNDLYADVFIQNLMLFENDPAIHTLVVDLRHNPGGITDVARDIIDAFIDVGPTMRSYHSLTPWLPGEGEEDLQSLEHDSAKKPGRVFTKNVFILVSEFSVSAAEVVSAALQAYGVAIILGTPTKGKGVTQIVQEFRFRIGHEIRSAGRLQIADSRWFAPDGYDVHRRGVRIDFNLDDRNTAAYRQAARDRAGKLNPETHKPFPFIYYKDEPDLRKAFDGYDGMMHVDFKPQFTRSAVGLHAIGRALETLPEDFCLDKPDCELAKTLVAIDAYVKVHK